jgi:hypothetical protein
MTHDDPLATAHGPALPAGLRSLWEEACGWVDFLLGMFDPASLRAMGLSRARGVRLTLWLANIEGAVRRLILAAALVFVPSSPQRTPRPAHGKPRPARARRAGFRVFRLRGSGKAHAHAPPPGALKPYGHVVFPADPLLSLGLAPARASRLRAPRARNPLDRWVRPARHDPDWRPSELARAGSAPQRPLAFARDDAPRPRAEPALHGPLPASLWDWRRRHDAWREVIPAPLLAARLDALARAAAAPAALIARAARRLAQPHNAGPGRLRNATPRTHIPRRARHLPNESHAPDFTQRCHDELIRRDTS